MYKIGIDVGGTNTDAVLIDENLNVVASMKTPTTDDIYTGIITVLHGVLAESKINPNEVKQAMLGTTHCTNAIVERKNLTKIALMRIGSPAMDGILPMVDWPKELKKFMEYSINLKGGYEYNGKEIMPFDKLRACEFLNNIKGKVHSVAISCIFSPVRHEHEDECAKLAREILGEDVHISKSSEIGSLSFIERENATILNACLYDVTRSFIDGFAKSLKDEGILDAKIYLSQNDGTLMTIDFAKEYPILTIACGPTNSIRGASSLSKIENAIVIDVGGTTTDFGVIQNSFPRESGIAVTIGGVRTNFRMPDILSMGLGGGSIIRSEGNKITIGPDSVGYKITKEALVFGGKTLTTTDIAVRLNMADIGDKSLVAHIDEGFARACMDKIKEMVEENLDKMKTSNDNLDVILVGGGSIIVPDSLIGAKSTFKPDNFSVANAIGSAISKVSGVYEKLISFDEIPRDKALEIGKSSAIEMAVSSGAILETVKIIDVEDVPLAYYPGNTSRVKIKAAGDLK